MTDNPCNCENDCPNYIKTCGKCRMFACPIFRKYPKVKGCNYGPDVMTQIKKAKRAKSRDFEDICKELGI